VGNLPSRVLAEPETVVNDISHIDYLFDDRDVLVIVDDWKAGDSRAPEAPAYFTGRVLFARDRANLAVLYSLLSQDGAAQWHASGNRSSSHFLFDAPHFREIADLIGNIDSLLVDMLNRVQGFDSTETRSQWQMICERNPVMSQWKDADSHAVAFFRYAEFLSGFLSQILEPKTRVRLVIDSLDWLTGHESKLVSGGPGLVSLGWGERGILFEALAISDKQGSAAAAYLPLLGLVDSEAWAFGRFQSLKFEDGKTVRQRALEWRDAGAAPNFQLFTEAEFAHLLSPHAKHQQLLRYWALCAEWTMQGRVICLAETDSTSMIRGREMWLKTHRRACPTI
jgi:hypothetical protein